ncbi:MAG: glycogen/starch synthase [Paludibacteraceae bacterium]|jgi:starch synthase|nr:glycogen/starch synthase [Paludibacteraceae bacterium]
MKDQEPVKILYITQEINPYIKETEIADICRQFPQYTIDKGCEIRTFMPCFGHINERRNQLHEVQRLSGLNVIIDDNDHPLIIKVATIQATRMQVYFIDNEDYFHRNGIAKDKDGNFFDDNDERGIFYVRSVLETIKKLRWTPDIIHIHGWISALAPLYIKKSYASDPFFANSKIIYSVYNDDFECPIREGFDNRVLFDDINPEDVELLKGELLKTETLNKIAINYSDAVICSSNTISEEVERYIKEKNVPYLPYQEENMQEGYWNFFCEVYPQLKDSEED